MNWFVVSQGKRTGPYDRAALRNMLETNAITIDTHVIREGTSLARRLYCSPEILFSDILPDSQLPTQREATPENQHENEDTLVESQEPARLAPSPAAPPAEEPSPGQAELDRQAKERARALADKEAKEHAQAIAEREAKVRAQLEEMRRREEQSRLEQERKQRAILQNGFSSAEMSEGTAIARRRKRRAAELATGQQVGAKPRQGPRKKQPIPKSLIAKSQVQPPSHQLPKAASEAKLQVQGDFNWAKNRVNPTAQMNGPGFHGRDRRRPARGLLPWLPLEAKILLFGSVAILAVFAILLAIKAATSKRQEPRFSLREARQIEAMRAEQRAANTLSFDDPKEIVINEPKEVKAPKESATNRQSTKTNVKSSQKKNSKSSKKSASSSKKRDASKKTASQSLKARPSPSRPIPNNWPKPRLNRGADLTKYLYKTVTLVDVRLLQAPDYCQPCQIPARFSDGTRVLLTTTTVKPWKAVFDAKAYTVKANGLLTKSYGYYTLIVNEVLP